MHVEARRNGEVGDAEHDAVQPVGLAILDDEADEDHGHEEIRKAQLFADTFDPDFELDTDHLQWVRDAKAEYE